MACTSNRALHRSYLLLPLAILLISGTPLETLQEDEVPDYQMIDMADPLQPVWDRLDTLSNDIVQPLREEMQQGFVRVENNLERKMRTIISGINSRISNLISSGSSGSSGISSSIVNNTMAALLRSFYEARIQVDRDEATAKIERHINDKVSEMETALKSHFDDKFSGGLADLEALATSSSSSSSSSTPSIVSNSSSLDVVLRLDSLVRHIEASNSTLQEINTHMGKINEKLGDEGDICSTLEDKVSELMNNAAGRTNRPSVPSSSSSSTPSSSSSSSSECLGLSDEYARELRSAVDRLRETPTFLPRDCSDHHWQRPDAPSGVFTTFPTMDSKSPQTVYCEMGEVADKTTGGWTVIIRRQNSSWGLMNFNRTWKEYRSGFGSPGEGEWFYGLAYLHALTYRQPYELQLHIRDIEDGSFGATYTTFRVEDESQKFSLVIDGFSGNMSMDALAAKHHGSPFSTYDSDNDEWEEGNCAVSNSGGWWFNRCHYTTLTAPFPESTDREAKTIRWRNGNAWMVLDDVTVMIRPVGYISRFTPTAEA